MLVSPLSNLRTFAEDAIQDLKYGFRLMIKSPGFAFAVVATLALGIGATTAVFSIVYGITLRPLPYPQQNRLVTISHDVSSSAVGVANYLDWRAQNTVFDEVGITKLVQNFNITGDGEPERVLGGRSTASTFRVLGVHPILGRVFTEEDGPNEDKVVLSYGLWERRYAADPSILGKKIQLNGVPYTVLGVMPAEFQYRNREFALWTPLMINPDEARSVFDYGYIARLKDGISLSQAQAEMSVIQSRIGAAYPDIQRLRIHVSPMLDDLVGSVRTPLYFLLGSVLGLLLIGCANLANLLVARSMTRSQELVLRSALGAGKLRLILQSIIELAPLVVLGGICGIVLARWLLFLLVPLLPSAMPRLEGIRLDWQVLVFAAICLFATAIAAGIWPALQVMRWNVNQALRESSRTTSFGAGATRLRSALVVCQIAAVVVLMVVSALLIRSFTALQNVDPGFRSDNILSIHFALSSEYGNNPEFGQYLKRILERASSLPGVVSAGMVNRLPLAGQTQNGTLEFEGIPPQDPRTTPASRSFDWRTATPDYFRTLGIPLIEGRVFQESDTADRPRVGIIDQQLARLLWPNQSAIGKRFRFSGGGAWFEIVGVVGHVRHDGLGVDRRPQVYWSYHQRSQPRMALAVRTGQDPRPLTTSIIAAIHEVDPNQPVYDVRPMEDVVERSLSPQWLNTSLLTLFASVALVLATVGVYGLLSYSVGLRAREIGIRMALGSQRHEIIWMVLRKGILLACLGTSIGVVGALLLKRILGNLLYGIQATDAVSFLAASFVLLLVAFAASYIPARRAASVDPSSLLRME
jgi:putative ABC transport system permease protein